MKHQEATMKQTIYASNRKLLPAPNSFESQVYTILIIDDSETDRVTYQRYIGQMSSEPFVMLEADCGEEGLALCLEQSPDLVLLDYRLPDLDGLEFLRQLQSRGLPLPPVVMLTGEGSEKVAVEAMKFGARDYLVKGDLTADSFNQVVKRVLSQQALEQLASRREQQQQLLGEVALQISRAEGISDILKAATEGARDLLDCDRTVIFRFDSDMNGTIVAESVLSGWIESLNQDLEETCFREGHGVADYLNGRKLVISDVHKAGLSPCHLKMLTRFQVRANLVVPIVTRDSLSAERKLWGLLVSHHCRAARRWQYDELMLMDDLSVQLTIALQQAELIDKLQVRAVELTTANEKLEEYAGLLEERNRELDEFAYVASHDLRAPLRAIANLAQWIEEDIADQIPAENQQQLSLLQSRVKRLDNFIIGLLDYSRAGRDSIEPSEVDVGELLQQVVDELSPPSTFSFVFPKEKTTCLTEALLLKQVLSNLIGNAVKYHGRSDGSVSVEVTRSERALQFAITDDGPGIAPGYHDRIFGVFQTISARDEVESTGIGLSIVKKLVEQQGGQIQLRSTLGSGSTFSFTWPHH